ncbi:xanthine dehydrogenase accessory protein XdhC [Noviherbaspirillum sp.]|uniref:xanthine dehydrogenase accessory protein XdhC n=1 Tax=Noviherbaspirillum sp. TaxID=1926288 RepID=UPI002B4826F6|nr:xanthine dehydrogenase accessory protein XdhC [Noviherbaspirillum sp.]HJV79954.1 xanthine dehydrogenase accessory protein XdhC [Noviherbaspirillum sp.]
MTDWLSALSNAAARAEPAVLVTVASVQGSSPREPGAKMLVTAKAQCDTIGGGHLEMRAAEIAHEMLAMPSGSLATMRRIERFALGPSLGQCCGGVVLLAFERIEAKDRDYAVCLNEYRAKRQDYWRLVALDASLPAQVIDKEEQPLCGALPPPEHIDLARECHIVVDSEGCRWLVDPLRAYRAHLVLFGAGHVGAAIVRALAELPCHVTWVDEREDMFPESLPANVKTEVTDTPEAVVDEVSPGASYLVMTHSHALDQRLAEAILRRTDAGWFGLIGSESKRVQFERRLRARGMPEERLKHMICPVGVPGISGKTPAVIAASVCAQLLQVWEKSEQTEQVLTPNE